MTQDSGQTPASARDAVKKLEGDAASLMEALSTVTAKLKAAGSGDPKAVEDATAQLKGLQERIMTLTADSRRSLAQLDRSIRDNPYPYLIGALGLGVILGKVTRS